MVENICNSLRSSLSNRESSANPRSDRVLSGQIWIPLFSYEGKAISIVILVAKLRGKSERGKADGHHFSWWTRVKDSRKHELVFSCSNTKIGRVKWISPGHRSMIRNAQDYMIDWVELCFQTKKDGDCRPTKCLYSLICRRMRFSSTQLRPSREPDWFSQVCCSRVLDSRQMTKLTSSSDEILIKLTLVWYSVRYQSAYL